MESHLRMETDADQLFHANSTDITTSLIRITTTTIKYNSTKSNNNKDKVVSLCNIHCVYVYYVN